VPPGTVVISGLPKEYYGSIIMSAAAAANQARQKENERARFEAEAGKTYYFKWTAGAFATGIKVTPVDPENGAKEIRTLHLSKPVDDKEEAKLGREPTDGRPTGVVNLSAGSGSGPQRQRDRGAVRGSAMTGASTRTGAPRAFVHCFVGRDEDAGLA
jgi:hypothetical protein